MSRGKTEKIVSVGGEKASFTFRILAINPGSTSTKLSVFEDETERIQENIAHAAEDIRRFKKVIEQEEFRMKLVRSFLEKHGLDIKSFRAIVGRGGLLKPIKSGVYRINETMLADLREARFGEHASNLGGLLAHRVGQEAGCAAYIVDPVVVDEMDDIARVTGMPELQRKSIFHALNQKSAAREVARKIRKPYEACNFIVAHMGGGITVGAHRHGRVVDVNNGLDGDGPFAPERAGSLPAGQLVEMCFSGKYTLLEMKRKLTGQGGLVAWRGSNSFHDLKTAMRSGDAQAQLLFNAMAYQVGKQIAMYGATLKGQVDRIVLTGGLACDNDFVEAIKERVAYLAEVEVIPGEREMTSLAGAVLAVLRRQEADKEYC